MSIDPARFRGVYALIDPAAHAEPLAYLDALLRGGIRLVQIRAKGGIAPALLRTVVARIRDADGTAIVNDDVELAMEADGVHLGQEDLAGHDLAALRARLGTRAIGLSCGTPAEARALPAGLVDYIGAGPIFATATKGDAGGPIGVNGVRVVVEATPLPVAAIGGITLASVPLVRETGAAMAAVISALSGASDPEGAARAFTAALVRAMTPAVAAVGTTHPFGAAGLLLDLTAIRALGAVPLAIVAGVSAQNAEHVLARAPVDPATIAAQFAALGDTPVGAFCVGALLDPASVRAVAAGLARYAGVPVICDPVIAASGGDRLAGDATIAAMRADLFARCTLLTPNLAEAALLAGTRITDLPSMHAALPALLALGSDAVLLKGGHLDGDACDVFATAGDVRELRASRLPHDLRGTGSLLACAIAVRCAFGDALPAAIDAARDFVRDRITHGTILAGMRIAFGGEELPA